MKETLHNLKRRGGGLFRQKRAQCRRQALDRLGDWLADGDSGLVSAQTYNTANTHCAPGIRYNQFCQITPKRYLRTYAVERS